MIPNLVASLVRASLAVLFARAARKAGKFQVGFGQWAADFCIDHAAELLGANEAQGFSATGSALDMAAASSGIDPNSPFFVILKEIWEAVGPEAIKVLLALLQWVLDIIPSA